MIQKLFILIALILFASVAFGQSIRDTVFNNVIPINHQYVTTEGTNFLIDIPIKPQKEPIIILNNDRRIPVQLFFDRKSFLSEQNEIILITRDWEYIDRIDEMYRKKSDLHVSPYWKNKFYFIKRGNTSYTVDSISRAMEIQPFHLNYKKAEQFMVADNKKCYYVTCNLPNDVEYSSEVRKALDSLNTRFNIYVGFYYASGCVSYSLSSLPLEKKLPAIKAIAEVFRFKGNDHLKDFYCYPKIYLPYAINPDSFDFYVESSKYSLTKSPVGWQDNENTATIRMGYWRGNCCGDVPETKRVSAKIINDTVFVNYNRIRDPKCNPSIGVCGNAIDFVINKRKYPNYKNLIFKTIE